MKGILGKKLGMSRVFDDAGKSVAVTVIQAGPCKVAQIKTEETDGYNALQLGFEEKKEKHTTRPVRKHLEKAGLKPMRLLREIRDFEGASEMKLGDEIKVDLFSVGERVSVTGVSKGKGFQGVVKRHGFSGGPKTHGQSDRLRAPGSVGQSSYPSRVYKGVRMAGRMGNDRVTARNKRVIKVVPDKNLIMLEGDVPGAANGFVFIKRN